jgi:hypothetical protein
MDKLRYACYVATQAVLGTDWKGHPLGPSQGPFSCLRPIMPLIQHLSAVGRVPPCNTANLLSLRHLSPLTIFISPLHLFSILTKLGQPPTEIEGSLSRNLDNIVNQSTLFAFYPMSWQVRHSELGVARQATMPACGV